MSRVAFFSSLGILTLAACSSGDSSNGTTTGPSPNTITISNFTFNPDPLVVPASSTVTTVTVINTDPTNVHTATSEAAANDFPQHAQAADGGFVFDTNNIPTGSSATFTVPAGLPSGTIQPYFCVQHTNMMKNPNPTIQIK
jgi:hypothetical protein